MSITIALAGNPNSGKTTLFNALTGSNQYVGNWPGVTVEKKEGRLKGHKDVILQDLPGIYSLSPYTLEEVVARGYLVKERPDAILNIVDGTNIERNLYLTTQLIELGIPVVVAVNMMDAVRKNGDAIDLVKLGKELGCAVVPTSALKGEGGMEAAEKAIELANTKQQGEHPHVFTGSVEHAIAHIEESISALVEPDLLRWYAIKLFERDSKAAEELGLKGYDTFLRHDPDNSKQYASDNSIETHRDFSVTILDNAIPGISGEGRCMIEFAKFYTGDPFADVKEADYFKVKDRIARECVERYESVTGCNIHDHIEEIVIASPVTWARYLGTPRGDVYGYEPANWDGMFPRVQSGHKLDYTVQGLRFAGGHGTQMDGFSQAYLSGAEQARYMLLDMQKEGK